MVSGDHLRFTDGLFMLTESVSGPESASLQEAEPESNLGPLGCLDPPLPVLTFPGARRGGARGESLVRGWSWQVAGCGGRRASFGGPRLCLFPTRREKSHPSVPYHYFEKGRLDECQMYLAHERAPRSAHRFITEKAVFSRWAKKRPIVFAHPSWRTQ